MCVVSRVKGIGQNDKDIVLDQLTTDQVCFFATNIGVPNFGLKNKFVCHLAIASHFEFQHNYQILVYLPLHGQAKQQPMFAGLSMSSLVNSSSRISKKSTRKSWAFHESGNTHKHFWIRAAMAYNNRLDDDVMDDQSTEHTAVAFPEDIKSTMDDDFATLIVSYGNPILAELVTNEEVDLAQFEHMEMNAFQKKCLDLFKVQSILKENMMKSGTHDSDPYNFVEVAMRGFMGLTPISVFYFYKWCDKHPDIDLVFQPFMNDTLKGNSITLGTCDGNDMSPSTLALTSKTVLIDQMDTMVQQGNQLLELLKTSVEEQKLE